MSTLERIAPRLAVVIALVCVPFLCAAPSAVAGCGQEYRGTPKTSSVPGGPPLAIGDSVLADAVPQLVGYGFEADGMVCRQMSQGITILRERAGRLPHLVVLALGTNGEVSDAQIHEALTILGPQRILVLVTPHGAVVPSTPDVIRAAAAADPSRIVLLDWDRLAGEHKDWLAPDGVHLGGTAGIDGFAALVAGALQYADTTSAGSVETEGDNIDPGTPETLPSPPEHHKRARHRQPAPASALLPATTNSATRENTVPAPAPVAARATAGAGSDSPSAALIGGVAAAAVVAALAVAMGLRRRRAGRQEP